MLTEISKRDARHLGIGNQKTIKKLDMHGQLTLVNTQFDHWVESFQKVRDPQGRAGHRVAMIIYTINEYFDMVGNDPHVHILTWHCFNPWGS